MVAIPGTADIPPTAATTAPNTIANAPIIGGTIIALVTQITLSLLGIGIGASTIHVQNGQTGSGLGSGSAIWLVLTILISLFAGGYVAGRLAGFPAKQEGTAGRLDPRNQRLLNQLGAARVIACRVGSDLGHRQNERRPSLKIRIYDGSAIRALSSCHLSSGTARLSIDENTSVNPSGGELAALMASIIPMIDPQTEFVYEKTTCLNCFHNRFACHIGFRRGAHL